MNISSLKDCYGCGVCVISCPVKIIELIENRNGFYSPRIINESKCINCGLCLKVCAYYNKGVAKSENTEIKTFAAWSSDETIREMASSGGAGYEIGKKLIEDGYNAIGVRYNYKKNRAEHFISSSIEQFLQSVGSKYIPSYSVDALNSINKNNKYLVTGTPCQIDSIRRYIQHFRIENNFVLLDFFCHGVPSLLLWDKYIENITKKIGSIGYISWRNKATGWHDSWAINADSKDSVKHCKSLESISFKSHDYTSRRSAGDIFYYFFLGNYCLNKCCYSSCKYKLYNSAADIRIGDLWGSKFKNNSEGITATVSFTKKGEEVLLKMGEKDYLILLEESKKATAEGQMADCAKKPYIRGIIMAQLRMRFPLQIIKNITINLYKLTLLPLNFLRKFSM